MKKNILIMFILTTAFFGLFALFICINESSVRKEGQHKTEYFGEFMKNYLWSLDQAVAVEYAGVVANESGFHEIKIIDSSGEEFLNVREDVGKSSAGGVFSSLGLVYDIEFTSDINHEGNKIGEITAKMKNKSVYTYVYVFVCLVLVLCLVALLFGSARAKSKRKLAELALYENRKNLHRVVSNAPIIAFSLDQDLKFKVCEGRGLSKLKNEGRDLIGKHVNEVFGGNKGMLGDFERTLAGESFSKIRKLGKNTYDISYSPALEKGEIKGVAGVATDVTDLKLTLDALASKDKVIQSEMEIARKTHQAMVPTKLPNLEGFEFGLVFKPWGGLGGDFISFKDRRDGGLGVAFADISGHGVSAALLSSVFQVVLDDVMSKELPLAESFLKMNSKLVSLFPSDRFASTFYAVFDARSRVMRWVKAAQEPAIHFRVGEDAKLISNGGPVLGIVPPDLLEKNCYTEESLELVVGDTVFLYTDGLLEVEDEAGVMIEREILVEWIEAMIDLPPQELCETIYQKVVDYAGNKELDDDVAVFAARLNHEIPEEAVIQMEQRSKAV